MPTKTIQAVDLFCGAGGTSTGLIQACERLGYGLDLLAVNHWETAVATHSANHPGVNHLCESLDKVNPRHVVPSGRLDLLVASPECTHHSIARGGKPCNEQSRASAWHVLRWAEALRPTNILVENVREFRDWRPLRRDGHPDKRYRKGYTYAAWLGALRGLGYTVEERLLRSADYGDPTTRQRLFVLARRGRLHVPWPEQTHAPEANGLAAWNTARGIINWDVPGNSIFGRKRPLAEKTIARIATGLRKFGGAAAEPFLVLLKKASTVRSIDEPLPTLTTIGHVGLCEPFLVPQFGERPGQDPRVHSIDKPMPAATGHGAGALVQPFILPHRHGGSWKNTSDPRSIERPLPTITANSSDIAVVEPFLMNVNHGKADTGRPRDLDRPLPTLTAKNGHALIEPFLVKYYGTGRPKSVDLPIDTLTTKGRFGLVETAYGPAQLDIRFRMLLVEELARGMGFPEGYEFMGTKSDQVKQIGNAVSVGLGEALCGALLAG